MEALREGPEVAQRTWGPGLTKQPALQEAPNQTGHTVILA